MVHTRSFSQIETLRSGVSITIRAVRFADKDGIASAFSQLDPESIYTRFFHAKVALSDQELKTATEIDFERVVALVATVESEGRETIIGGGRYMAFDSPAGRTAEVAFLVEEDYQGQGIATRILNHLVRIAREKGVDRFEAEVLPGNTSMLAVFSRSGLPMKQSETEGVVHVTLSLNARSGVGSAASERVVRDEQHE
jgi:RimJ/RimL family protein N-acetyltransferase